MTKPIGSHPIYRVAAPQQGRESGYAWTVVSSPQCVVARAGERGHGLGQLLVPHQAGRGLLSVDREGLPQPGEPTRHASQPPQLEHTFETVAGRFTKYPQAAGLDNERFRDAGHVVHMCEVGVGR